VNLADALDGQCLGIPARIHSERARREPHMRQVEQQAATGLAYNAADDLRQVGGPHTFVGVGWVVLRDDALGAEAADDRRHVGD
jgi:hypothetical protein